MNVVTGNVMSSKTSKTITQKRREPRMSEKNETPLRAPMRVKAWDELNKKER